MLCCVFSAQMFYRFPFHDHFLLKILYFIILCCSRIIRTIIKKLYGQNSAIITHQPASNHSDKKAEEFLVILYFVKNQSRKGGVSHSYYFCVPYCICCFFGLKIRWCWRNLRLERHSSCWHFRHLCCKLSRVLLHALGGWLDTYPLSLLRLLK